MLRAPTQHLEACHENFSVSWHIHQISSTSAVSNLESFTLVKGHRKDAGLWLRMNHIVDCSIRLLRLLHESIDDILLILRLPIPGFLQFVSIQFCWFLAPGQVVFHKADMKHRCDELLELSRSFLQSIRNHPSVFPSFLGKNSSFEPLDKNDEFTGIKWEHNLHGNTAALIGKKETWLQTKAPLETPKRPRSLCALPTRVVSSPDVMLHGFPYDNTPFWGLKIGGTRWNWSIHVYPYGSLPVAAFLPGRPLWRQAFAWTHSKMPGMERNRSKLGRFSQKKIVWSINFISETLLESQLGSMGPFECIRSYPTFTKCKV